MIISHKHRFIFLKTRKTAGTSMEIALSQHCGPRDVITPILPAGEETRRQLGFRGSQNTAVPLANYGLRDWGTLIKRRERRRFYNHIPASQIIRWAGEEVWEDYFTFCFERNPFDKVISQYYFATRHASERPDISEHLRAFPTHKLSNRPIYTKDGQIAVDFVGRFERLHADLEHAWNRIGLPPERTMPKTKSSQREDRRHYSKVLSDEDRRIIDRVCASEIDELGYEYEEN